jgi:hypothetical protein
MTDVTQPDPLHVAWRAYASPDLGRELRACDVVCCRCGTTGPGVPATGVTAGVSGSFTDWDRLAWRHGGDGFCVPCAWGFGAAPLRWYPHILTHTSAARAAPTDLRQALSGPMNPCTLVSVPVSMQKHLLPYATWGNVATDNIQLPWTAADASRFGTYLALVALGFVPAAIAEQAPRWLVLAKLSPPAQAQAMTIWAHLDPWRQARPYLAVAARAVRTPKTSKEPPE